MEGIWKLIQKEKRYQFKLSIKDDQNLQISNSSVIEKKLLHGAQRDTALPKVLSC